MIAQRRRLRTLAAASVLLSLLCATTALGGVGCVVEVPFPSHRLRDSTGDAALDAAFVQEGKNLSKLFRINPAIHLLIDAEGPNAFAHPADTRPGYSRTVYFGFRLLGDELRKRRTVAVAGILAHEFGHILQFQHQDFAPGKHAELHADFLAGWYLGKKALAKPLNVEAFGRSLYEKGDYAVWDPSHHGTPEERVSAMLAGFGSTHLNLRAAYSQGAAVARGARRPGDWPRPALAALLDRVFGSRVESLAAEDLRRAEANLEATAALLESSSTGIRAAHVVTYWAGAAAEGGHVRTCPLCHATAAAIADGTPLAAALAAE